MSPSFSSSDSLLPTPDHPVVLVDESQNVERRQRAESIVLFAGSFNPLHRGHLALKRAAERHLQRPVTFELSLRNAEKSSVPFQEILARVRQFEGHALALTNSPLFLDKSTLFPNSWFLVGIDTAERIVDPRWYEDSEQAMRSCLKRLQERGHRFLVGGRVNNQGSFRKLQQVNIPKPFAELFVEIPESKFRVDISSTQIRQEMRSHREGFS